MTEEERAILRQIQQDLYSVGRGKTSLIEDLREIAEIRKKRRWVWNTLTVGTRTVLYGVILVASATAAFNTLFGDTFIDGFRRWVGGWLSTWLGK